MAAAAVTACVIGIDPGMTTGIALLRRDGERLAAMAYQCSSGAAYDVVRWLAAANEGAPAQGEAFVPGRGAGARQRGAAVTRALIAGLDALLGDRVRWRSAAAVKPWATDARLKAAGLLELTAGMPHARDALRHALFRAVHDLGWPDPMSRKGRIGA